MAKTLAAVEQLRSLNVIALKRRYEEVFGETSRSSNKQFLFRRIAWRLQANAEGGLTERARRRAAEIVDESDLRTPRAKGISGCVAFRHCFGGDPSHARSARWPIAS